MAKDDFEFDELFMELNAGAHLIQFTIDRYSFLCHIDDNVLSMIKNIL